MVCGGYHRRGSMGMAGEGALRCSDCANELPTPFGSSPYAPHVDTHMQMGWHSLKLTSCISVFELLPYFATRKNEIRDISQIFLLIPFTYKY